MISLTEEHGIVEEKLSEQTEHIKYSFKDILADNISPTSMNHEQVLRHFEIQLLALEKTLAPYNLHMGKEENGEEKASEVKKNCEMSSLRR